MVTHPGDELLVQQRLDDLGADGRVLPHQRPLLVCERAGLEQHAVGHRDLADVVQVRGLFEQLDPPRRPAQLRGK